MSIFVCACVFECMCFDVGGGGGGRCVCVCVEGGGVVLRGLSRQPHAFMIRPRSTRTHVHNVYLFTHSKSKCVT